MNISKNELQALLTPGNWFQFPKSFLEVFKPAEAILLAYLLNRFLVVRSNSEGWFVCGCDTLMEEIGYTKDQQQRALRALELAQVIEVQNASWHNRRQIRLGIFQLYELLKPKLSRVQGTFPIRCKEPSPLGARNLPHPIIDTIGQQDKHDGSTAPIQGFFGGRSISWTERASQVLEQHVRSTRRLARIPSRARWAQAFADLLKDVGNDRARVKKVLMWFVSNYELPKMVHVHSATEFRVKFTRIEERMKQEQSLSSPPSLVLDDEAEALVGALSSGGISWPKGSAQQVRVCVGTSIMAYRAWVAEALLPATKVDSRQGRFARYLLPLLGKPETFIRKWFQDANARVRGWKEWSGNLRAWVWHPGHRDFQIMLEDECIRYAGHNTPQLWEELVNDH